MIDRARMIHDIICGSVEAHPTRHEAQAVRTPFLDWKGAPVEVFVRKNGEVTDGGRYLNELRALRVDEDFNKWAHRADFLARYAIEEKNGALICADPNDAEAILAYIQGVARIGAYFEPKVKRDIDNFPKEVQVAVRPKLLAYAPPDSIESWMSTRFSTRRWNFDDGATVETDLHPVDDEIMVQVVARATAYQTEQRQHVGSKLLPFEMVRNRRKPRKALPKFVIVLPDIALYPPEAQNLIQHAGATIVSWTEPTASDELANILGSRDASARLLQSL